MKDRPFISSTKCLGVLTVLISTACCGWCALQAYRWEPIGLSGGGGMFTPAISPADPNLMMLNCDMSAAYISEDGGHNWRMIHQAQLRTDTQCRPGFHPSDANVIYASSQGRLRISRDRGRTFKSLGNLLDSLSGEIAINASDPNVMLVGTRRGLCQLSRDAGSSWSACSGPQGQVIGFHFPHSDKGHTMFAATDKGIWCSDDGGVTWAERTNGLPWKEINGFAGASDSSVTMLYCTVTSKMEDGRLRGGVYRSRDRGHTWELAMGHGINKDTTKADQWSYGPIAQYKQVMSTDAKPSTVYVTNTSTGFHPPHHETVYRSDDGGDTWRATFFQDPRFKQYNVAPNYVTASAGQSYKGGGTPFGTAICNSDPNRLILVWSQSYITHNGGMTWFNGDTYPAAGQQPQPGSAWACTGLVVTTTWNYYIDPFPGQPSLHCLYRYRVRAVARQWEDLDLVGQEYLGPVAQHVLRNRL